MGKVTVTGYSQFITMVEKSTEARTRRGKAITKAKFLKKYKHLPDSANCVLKQNKRTGVWQEVVKIYNDSEDKRSFSEKRRMKCATIGQ